MRPPAFTSTLPARFAALAFAALVSACGGGGGSEAPPPPPPKAGQFDPSFGRSGLFELVAPEFAATSTTAGSLSIDRSGRLLAAGWTSVPGTGLPNGALFVRVLPSGLADPGFAGSGYVRITHPVPRRDVGTGAFPIDAGRSLVVDAGQDICTLPPHECPAIYPWAMVRRLNADGSVDPALLYSFAPVYQWQTIGEPDGSIVIMGTSDPAHGSRFWSIVAARVHVDGVPDPEFGTRAGEAMKCPGLPDTSFHVVRLARLADGKFLVARKNTAARDDWERIRICVSRLMPDGSLDTTYGTEGRLYVDNPQYVGTDFIEFLEGGDGRVALVQRTNIVGRPGFGSIVWLTAGGAVDMAMGTGGLTSPLPALGHPTSAAIQADGRILVAGWPNKPASSDLLDPWDYGRPSLVRLDASGGADATFGEGGVALLVAAGIPLQPSRVTVGADASIFVAGSAGRMPGGTAAEPSRLAIGKIAGRGP
jgi:uncharacterized delta-60 repeat protein